MSPAATGLALALAYAIGSIPAGLWLGLGLRGIDIRQHGSKNVGATNTMRVLGKGLGALALLGDAGKGAVAVLLIARISPWEHAALACGIAAILGHTYSLFLRFRGGKGVATSLGVFLSLCPLATGIAAVAFFAVVAATRMASAGSIAAAAALTVAIWALPHPLPVRVAVTAVAVLVVVKHRTNIVRILQGRENRL